ncbi:MAG: SH3 domain-containing protein [Prevotella sp.]|nr:SH3 domain-containing protein [Prevotella sp.]
MKKIIILIVILIAGYLVYDKFGAGKGILDKGVLKQVTVAVKTANLRTGPGTDFEVALNDDSQECVVNEGDVLDVVGEENGWYEVRVDNSTSTAFIKQSLCADQKADQPQKKAAAPKRKKYEDPGVPATSSKRISPDLSEPDEEDNSETE